MATSLLVVDDDHHIRAMLQRGLGYEGFRVTVADDGERALGLLRTSPVDCIVLDVRMPQLDGLEVCRRLRNAGDTTPIIILTAYDTVGDRVTGLEAGADDYLVKPFAFEELLARVRALLRRRQPEDDVPVLRFADLTLDRQTLEVVRAGRTIDLTPREFELLEAFMRRPRQVLGRDELLARVWGYDFETETNVVDVYVLYLRRKLEAAGGSRLLHTVRGAGYALREGRDAVLPLRARTSMAAMGVLLAVLAVLIPGVTAILRHSLGEALDQRLAEQAAYATGPAAGKLLKNYPGLPFEQRIPATLFQVLDTDGRPIPAPPTRSRSPARRSPPRWPAARPAPPTPACACRACRCAP